MYSDTKSCEDYRSEGVTRHMSTQGMLERLVNSIIEGLLKKSCKTICSRGYHADQKKRHTFGWPILPIMFKKTK